MTKIQWDGCTGHLNRRPAENIFHGFDFAAYLGHRLNNYVVLNFDADSADRSCAILRAVHRKFRCWLNRRTRQLYGEPLPPMFVYTHENPDGHAHCNWVVHVPPELQAEFERKCRRWVERAYEAKRPFDLIITSVEPGTEKTLAKYICKGIDPRYIDYLHLQAYATPQGRVWGRRAGTSEAISRAARRAAGFVPKRDRGKVRSADNDNARRAA